MTTKDIRIKSSSGGGEFDCYIALPDGSGLELVAEAKKRQRFMKAVALTGLGQAEDRDRGLRAGFDEYLTKPVDLYQLCAVLD